MPKGVYTRTKEHNRKISESLRGKYYIIETKKEKPKKKAQEREKCEHCGKKVRHYNSECYTKHINIEHNPAVLYFCCKECKLKWIFQTQEKELKLMIQNEI